MNEFVLFRTRNGLKEKPEEHEEKFGKVKLAHIKDVNTFFVNKEVLGAHLDELISEFIKKKEQGEEKQHVTLAGLMLIVNKLKAKFEVK